MYMRSYRAFVCALYIAVNRTAEFLSRARRFIRCLFIVPPVKEEAERANAHVFIGRLIVDRVLVVLFYRSWLTALVLNVRSDIR